MFDSFCIRPSIGTENPIPEEMDHCEIAVRVSMMNEVQFLFASEPCKPLKSRSLYVVFFVEKDVRIERRRTCGDLNHEEIKGNTKYVHAPSRNTGMKKKGVLLPSSPRYARETRWPLE